MNFNFLLLIFALTIHTGAHAASKNACDDLEDAGSASAEKIQECRKSLGESDYYKSKIKSANEQKKLATVVDSNASAKADAAAAKAAKYAANIQTETFDEEKISASVGGQPVFAQTDDYRSGIEKHDVLTTPEVLCKRLGFEKAGMGNYSNQIFQPDSNNKGFIIKKTLFGSDLKIELYKQDDPKVGVRKYVSITCSKRIDKKLDPTSEGLKSIVTDMSFVDNSIQAQPIPVDGDSQIVNAKRDSKLTTPHGYKKPDWMNDNGAAGAAK
jgi:hypothetical protein